MRHHIEQLGPKHLEALKQLLAKDPTHNLYLLGVLEEFGIVCDPTRAPFAFHGRFTGESELTAAIFVGGSGGLVIPSAGPLNAITDLARALSATVQLKSCIGEKMLVDVLVQHLNGQVKFSKLQRLYSVSADDLGPFTNPLLRVATEADVPRLVPLAAACVKELHERDPLADDAEGFAVRVKQRVMTKRTYVLEENGQLVFKLDIGSRSQFGAELEGVFTDPGFRGKGLATLCLGQISRFLLSSLPRLTLRVDDSNSAFAGIARKVGYVGGRGQRFVWGD
ncbi:MAG: GNAT family N-acetyltransferase [Myxococcaceae bacterium]|nr:GNAT family N-acetyltransferase [Myxococcaceae bacterium]